MPISSPISKPSNLSNTSVKVTRDLSDILHFCQNSRDTQTFLPDIKEDCKPADLSILQLLAQEKKPTVPHKYELSVNRCVLVDADRLARLIEDSGIDASKMQIDIECSDFIKRSYSSLDQLRSFPNAPNSRIRKLSFELGSYSSPERFEATFRSSFILQSFRCEATSDDEATLRRCRDALDSFFDRNAPWWALFSRIDYAGWRAMICLIGVSIIIPLLTQKWSIIPLVPLVPMGGGWILAAIVPRVFPRSNFVIGSGESRFNRAEVWRIVVLVGFAISLAASIVATELYRH